MHTDDFAEMKMGFVLINSRRRLRDFDQSRPGDSIFRIFLRTRSRCTSYTYIDLSTHWKVRGKRVLFVNEKHDFWFPVLSSLFSTFNGTYYRWYKWVLQTSTCIRIEEKGTQKKKKRQKKKGERERERAIRNAKAAPATHARKRLKKGNNRIVECGLD